MHLNKYKENFNCEKNDHCSGFAVIEKSEKEFLAFQTLAVCDRGPSSFTVCVFFPSEKHLDVESPCSHNPATSGEMEHPLMCLGAPALHFRPNFGWPGRIAQMIFQIFLRVSCIPSPDICSGQLTGLFLSPSTGSSTKFCSSRILALAITTQLLLRCTSGDCTALL